MFYFIFKKISESGPGTTHIHTFKENKQNFLTSIIVGINTLDHKKELKENDPHTKENFDRVINGKLK